MEKDKQEVKDAPKEEEASTKEVNEAKSAPKDDIFGNAKGGSPGASAVDSLIKEMSSKKKDPYVSPEMVNQGSEEEEGEDGQPKTEGPDQDANPFAENINLTEEQYEQNAKWIIEITDSVMAYSLSALALEEDSDYYKAKQAEKDQMVMALAEGLRINQSSFNIPWWAVLIFVALMAYGPKAGEAMRKRAEKNRQKESFDWREVKQDAPSSPQPPTERPSAPKEEAKTPANEGTMESISVDPEFKPVPEQKKDSQQEKKRYCEYPPCTNELTKTQKHYCSRDHNNKHRAMTGDNMPAPKKIED